MEAIGIIPARGGSERVYRKNMQDVGGQPLVEWTIVAALASNLQRVVVSTEDPEIAALAIRLGATVVPQPLASALEGKASAPVVQAALDFMADAYGYRPEVVCLLHPTSPFRGSDVINQALAMHEDCGGTVISVSGDKECGALYLTSVERFKDEGTFFVSPMHPLTLDEREGIDIDTWDDLERARRAA